jgi:hypothetical protein
MPCSKGVNSRALVLSPFVRMSKARNSTERDDDSGSRLLATTVLESYSTGTKVPEFGPVLRRVRGRGAGFIEETYEVSSRFGCA